MVQVEASRKYDLEIGEKRKSRGKRREERGACRKRLCDGVPIDLDHETNPGRQTKAKHLKALAFITLNL